MAVRAFVVSGPSQTQIRSLLTKEGSKTLTQNVAAAHRTQLMKAYVVKTSCIQLLLIDSVVGIAASVLGTVHRIATSFITWMHNLH